MKLGICFVIDLGLLCPFVVLLILGPLVFVGADGESANSSNGMAKCTVTVTVTTCVNVLSLIGLSCALLGFLCLFILIAAHFYVYCHNIFFYQ